MCVFPALCDPGWTFAPQTETCYRLELGQSHGATFDEIFNVCNGSGHVAALESRQELDVVAGTSTRDEEGAEG